MTNTSWRKIITSIVALAAQSLAPVNAYTSEESTGNVVGTINNQPAGIFTMKIVNRDYGLQSETAILGGDESRFPRVSVGTCTGMIMNAKGAAAGESESAASICSNVDASLEVSSSGESDSMKTDNSDASTVSLSSVDSARIVGKVARLEYKCTYKCDYFFSEAFGCIYGSTDVIENTGENIESIYEKSKRECYLRNVLRCAKGFPRGVPLEDGYVPCKDSVKPVLRAKRYYGVDIQNVDCGKLEYYKVDKDDAKNYCSVMDCTNAINR